MKNRYKYNYFVTSKKWLSILVTMVMLMTILSACTSPMDQSEEILMQSFGLTLSQKYNVVGEVSERELVLYRQLQLDNQKTKAEGGAKAADQFCYSENETENYNMGINRYNYGDSKATEWVDTTFSYKLTMPNADKEIQLTANLPPTKDLETGIEIKGAETKEIRTDVDILAAIQKGIESIEYKRVSGYKRLGKDIIRVEGEVIHTSEGIAVYDAEKDNFVSPLTGSIVKASSKQNVYNWENGDIKILYTSFYRLDFSVIDGRIVDLEGVIEEIENLPFDKRNFAKQGRIYTVTKPSISKEIIINIRVS